MNYMTTDETSAFITGTLGISVSRWQLIAYRGRGQGPRYHKIAGRILYTADDIVDWIESSVVDPTNTNEASNG